MDGSNGVIYLPTSKSTHHPISKKTPLLGGAFYYLVKMIN